MKKFVSVSLTYEGIHNWPKCNAMGVMYLKEPHRHLFYITLEKEVTKNDREIEIITLKNRVQDYLTDTYKGVFGGRSCEDIAEELLKKFSCSLVRVLEDNENGAVVEEKNDKQTGAN